jgi:hypothetical protein
MLARPDAVAGRILHLVATSAHAGR